MNAVIYVSILSWLASKDYDVWLSHYDITDDNIFKIIFKWNAKFDYIELKYNKDKTRFEYTLEKAGQEEIIFSDYAPDKDRLFTYLERLKESQK